jgi:hypothetical protein
MYAIVLEYLSTIGKYITNGSVTHMVNSGNHGTLGTQNGLELLSTTHEDAGERRFSEQEQDFHTHPENLGNKPLRKISNETYHLTIITKWYGMFV